MRAAVALAAVLAFAGCARRYRVEGMVLQVEPARGTLLVSHRAIKGYMPPMVMPVRVEVPNELTGIRPGDRVTFDLRIHKGEAKARNVKTGESALEGAGGELVLKDPAGKVPIGDLVPDFELTDQRSQKTRLSDLRGRVVVVNFIYTRCPLPEVCPRLSASFARLQRRFAGEIGSRLVLLSITLDPQYDTPAVLEGYARKWRAVQEGWRFLTGNADDVEKVASRFGVIYWPEQGLLTHTSSTCVLDGEGRLAARVDGSTFEPEQLADLVAQYLDNRPRD